MENITHAIVWGKNHPFLCPCPGKCSHVQTLTVFSPGSNLLGTPERMPSGESIPSLFKSGYPSPSLGPQFAACTDMDWGGGVGGGMPNELYLLAENPY